MLYRILYQTSFPVVSTHNTRMGDNLPLLVASIPHTYILLPRSSHVAEAKPKGDSILICVKVSPERLVFNIK
jgi:hypothetical protein